MDFIETILWPLRWLVELVLMLWHQLFTLIGLDPASGAAWVLSILGLVVVVRSLLIPVTVRQIKAQRRMMDLAPEMKKVQAKYKGKSDQFSREAMSRETMALYKKHGTNPFSSCLLILIQMPIFFSLFSVNARSTPIRLPAISAAAAGSVSVPFSDMFHVKLRRAANYEPAVAALPA